MILRMRQSVCRYRAAYKPTPVQKKAEECRADPAFSAPLTSQLIRNEELHVMSTAEQSSLRERVYGLVDTIHGTGVNHIDKANAVTRLVTLLSTTAVKGILTDEFYDVVLAELRTDGILTTATKQMLLGKFDSASC
jgi:hypothetical protein